MGPQAGRMEGMHPGRGRCPGTNLRAERPVKGDTFSRGVSPWERKTGQEEDPKIVSRYRYNEQPG